MVMGMEWGIESFIHLELWRHNNRKKIPGPTSPMQQQSQQAQHPPQEQYECRNDANAYNPDRMMTSPINEDYIMGESSLLPYCPCEGSHHGTTV
jgi:hypothetical protein